MEGRNSRWTGRKLPFEESYDGCKAVFNVMNEGGERTTESEFGLLGKYTYLGTYLLLKKLLC